MRYSNFEIQYKYVTGNDNRTYIFIVRRCLNETTARYRFMKIWRELGNPQVEIVSALRMKK